MGHKQSRNQRTENHRNNYPSGDNSGGQTYLSLLPRVISSGIIVFSSAFLVSLITASIVTPVQNSDAAQQIQASIDTTTGYYANVTGSDVVSLDIVATPDGAAVVSKDTITTETNSPTGFKLYISTNSTTATSNRMTHTNGENYLPAVDGGINDPHKLDVNTWGYALASTIGNNGSVTGSSYFIGMPLLNSENLIQNYTEAAPTGSGATVDVYFGAKANTALPSGTYTSTVVYTVLAEGAPAYEGEVSVSPNYSLMAGGGTVTIATGVYTNANDLGEIDVRVDGKTCTNLVATKTGANGAINITCTLPNLSSQSVGWKVVNVYMPKFGKTYEVAEGVQYYKPWSDLQYMQDMTDIACRQASTPTTSAISVPEKTLIDTRDGESYKVRKLADGECWMVENLRTTIYAGSTKVYVGQYDSSTGTIKKSTTSDNVFSSSNTDINGDMPAMGIVVTSEALPTAVAGAWADNNGNFSKMRSVYNTNTATDGDGVTQNLGTIYSWLAATFGSGKTEESNDVQVPASSICPRGWGLPSGYVSGETPEDTSTTASGKSWWHLLVDTYNVFGTTSPSAAERLLGEQKAKKYPFSIVPSGFYQASSATITNSAYGVFYVNTTFAPHNAIRRFTIVYGQGVYPRDHFGGSILQTAMNIRCVAR